MATPNPAPPAEHRPNTPSRPELRQNASDHDQHSSDDNMNDKDADSSPSTPPESAAQTADQLEKQAPTAPSTAVTHAEIIHRSQRRGLWGRFGLIPEVADPRTYKRGTKLWMTVIVTLAAATSSTGAAIFYPALALVSRDLNTSQTVVNLSLAFYLLAMAFTPMWWSAWSEALGRRSVYILSFSLFVIFSVLSAVSVNIGMLIAFRILTGGAAAAVQAVGAGTVADLWEPKERGSAMGIFYLGPLVGPGLAPIVGAAVASAWGWRATLWALCIFGAVMWLLIVLFLPETRFVHPFKAIALLQHPPILVMVWTGGMSFASLYVINIALRANCGPDGPYHFSTIIVGLLYIAPTLGYAVASQTGGKWIDYLTKRAATRAGRYDADGKPIYLPEDRMQENIWLAASLYPLCMMWYGWVVQYHIHWIVSSIAVLFFGMGSMLTFGCVTTMLTEFMPKRSSTGVALNNFVRQILATIATIVVQPLISAIGTGWMCTMIGLLAWLTGNLAILALKKRGPQWWVTMDRKLNGPKVEGEGEKK